MTKTCWLMRARKTRPLKISRNLRSKNPEIQLRKRDTRSIRRRKRTSVGMMTAKEVVTKDTEVSLVTIKVACSRVLLGFMEMMLKCTAISKTLEIWLDVVSLIIWWKFSSSQVKEEVLPSFILHSMTLICINLSSKIISLLDLSLQEQHQELDLTIAFQVVNLAW